MNDYYINKLLSGGIAGICEVTLTHPIDVIKIKLQNNIYYNKNKNINIFYKNLINSKLYAGYIPRVLGIIPMRCVFWSSQSISYNIYNKYIDNKKIICILSGVTGGFFQSIVDNPIEVLKNNEYILKILKEKYSIGYKATLSRNMIFAGIFGYGSNYYKSDNYYINFINAGFWGFLAAIISHPFDFIKTIQQNNCKKDIITIINENNIKTLMTGVIPRSILSISTMSIGSICYNYLINNN